VGQGIKACEEVRKAQSLDPLSPFFRAAGGLFLYFAGRKEEGIRQNLKAVELAPDFLVPHSNLSAFHFEMRNYDPGIREYEMASKLERMHPATLTAMLDAYRSGGISAFRREQLELNARGRLKLDASSLAKLHAHLGDKEKAIRYLHESVKEHGAYLEYLGVDPTWDSLRGEPEFQAILGELHLRQ
jgi:serine/threonine-protein kinase